MGQVNSELSDNMKDNTYQICDVASFNAENTVNSSFIATLTPPNENGKVSDVNNIKKMFLRLGTIRRRLAKSLRTSKNSDYRKLIHDLLQNWKIEEIKSFVKEYEGLEALKQLVNLSDAVRCKSRTLQDDIQILFDKNICTDTCVEYKSETYCVHKNLLISRHTFFATCFENELNINGNYEINIKDMDFSTQEFSSLLRYIYTGASADTNLLHILPDLENKFGKLHPLEVDLKVLHDAKSGCDVKLIFENQTLNNQVSSSSNLHNGVDCLVENNMEIFCHSFILCARSNFFKSCLSELFDLRVGSDKIIELVLNEKIIPRSYIRVVLNCFYTDVVDLTPIIKWKIADDGSGEADRLLTTSELAMELYEIGHFLEFSKLMEGCETIIVSKFNISTLLNVMDWSSQPFGSAYVHRQAMRYFRDEFHTLCKTPVFLANVPKKIILEAIKSDFLQANEEFILSTIIKWGEWQIAKANEKAGTSPANSLPRKSLKRRDIDNRVLFDTISDLLSHVRLKHILPSNSSVLHSAYQRGLLQRPFPFDVFACEKSVPTMAFWLRDCRCKHYQRPRLFTQYVHEAKIFLLERLAETDHRGTSECSVASVLPDMLPIHRNPVRQECFKMLDIERSLQLSIVDIVQLEHKILKQMVLREKELKSSKEALKALYLVPDSREISYAIQLRVVREFGLPDEVAGKLFQQTPDLIEESSSSSDSSKRSTLSKVGLLMKDDDHTSLSRETSVIVSDSPVRGLSHLVDHVPTEEELVSQTTLLLHKDKDVLDCSYYNPLAEGSPLRSIEDSPLDLPLSESTDVRLPNVLLDT